MHFNCPGNSLGKTSVLAFQKLWNCNNESDRLIEDGIYGAEVEKRLLKSPASGFSKTC